MSQPERLFPYAPHKDLFGSRYLPEIPNPKQQHKHIPNPHGVKKTRFLPGRSNPCESNEQEGKKSPPKSEWNSPGIFRWRSHVRRDESLHGLLGNGGARQDFGNDLIGGEAFQVSVRLEQHAMAEDRSSGGLDVIGNQEVTTLNCSNRFGNQHQGDRRAGTGPQTNRG